MRFLWMLVAILGGNLIYFSILRYLPEKLQHSPFRFDPGLLLDFLICLAIWLPLRRWTSREDRGIQPKQ